MRPNRPLSSRSLTTDRIAPLERHAYLVLSYHVHTLATTALKFRPSLPLILSLPASNEYTPNLNTKDASNRRARIQTYAHLDCS